MIKLGDKKECCGCNLCVQICPKECIALQPDPEGFLYPVTNTAICVDCNLCNNRCPIINVRDYAIPHDVKTLAAYNKNSEIRNNSSSGGVFYYLAKKIISKGGVVFGARFDDNWDVIHSWADNMNDLTQLMRSKYVQSYIGNSFKEAKEFLSEDRYVLFSGTPCQIAGLKYFLKRDYDKLICLDVVCHGVPNPRIWRKYLFEQKKEVSRKHKLSDSDELIIKDVNFRDKVNGWRDYNITISYDVVKSGVKREIKVSDNIWRNYYMLSFLKDFSVRPSCFDCKFRNGKSRSDITIADFWGIETHCEHTDFIADFGTSLVCLHSPKSEGYIDTVGISCIETNFSNCLVANPAIMTSWPEPLGRSMFYAINNKFNVKSAFIISNALNAPYKTIIKRVNKLKTKIYGIWQKLR